MLKLKAKAKIKVKAEDYPSTSTSTLTSTSTSTKSDTLIKVEGLRKKFCQTLKRSMLYGTGDAAKSMFGFLIEKVDLRKKEFWALKDINFE